MNLTSGLIGAETKGPIGWLIWDNPSKLNALSPGMSEDALSVIEAYEADPAIKVVVMRGAAGKPSSPAATSKASTKPVQREVARLAREAPASLRHKMLNLEKPLIAMIYGYCLGGGLGMALNADMRFASSDAQFSVPAALRGIAYAPEDEFTGPIWSPEHRQGHHVLRRRLKTDERCGSADTVWWMPRNWKRSRSPTPKTLAANGRCRSRLQNTHQSIGLERAQRDEARMDAMQREAKTARTSKRPRNHSWRAQAVFHGSDEGSLRASAHGHQITWGVR